MASNSTLRAGPEHSGHRAARGRRYRSTGPRPSFRGKPRAAGPRVARTVPSRVPTAAPRPQSPVECGSGRAAGGRVRALILVLCAVVVALTVPVILHAGGATRTPAVGERFHPGVLLFDARAG